MDYGDESARASEVFFDAAMRSRRQAAEARVSAELCDDCGGPIPEARRKAVPGCRLCIACQAESERSFNG